MPEVMHVKCEGLDNPFVIFLNMAIDAGIVDRLLKANTLLEY